MNNKYVRPGLEGSSSTSNEPTSQTPSGSAAGPSGASAAVPTSPSTSSSGKLSQGLLNGEVDNKGIGATSTVPTVATFEFGKKEVVIDGVAFESSARSLVRKDLPKPKPSVSKPPSTSFPPYVRKAGHLISASRSYKSKSRRGRGRGRNLTLDNTRKSWSERMEIKRRKYSNKPCPMFNTTGACNRGLTCMYQHDPTKIAICWNYLQDNCPNTAETCPLSHDPTPERTPLCVHFLNKGRCTRVGCLFPHVNVGKREGVCRDFAVLGYCEKGLDCDKQHVRECPDFAENGSCSTKGCKLPHVIRANRGRKTATTAKKEDETKGMDVDSSLTVPSTDLPNAKETPTIYAEDGKMGDEFISLTFHESEEEDEEDEDEDDEEEEEENEEEEEDEEESEESSVVETVT
ncbi:hypothetical protein EST38_g4186 [Candolleomyces aberdarensis]|uniref:C3H1-type domain-containing protein n=1 Tax=Candolleomyces aberdarensis TaxID=2316362 RepID=A0A4Q2DR31_9AGAR|nr:hypothetical protein EST38_g4186 [Candolleomyces aberdarensis]